MLFLASCAINPAIKQARDQIDAGRNEDGLETLDKAARENPDNHAYRSEYFKQRERTMAQWLAQAETLKLAGQHEAATIVCCLAVYFTFHRHFYSGVYHREVG